MGLRVAVLRCDQAMGELGSILHDSAVRQQDRCQTDTCHAPQSRLRMGQERLCKDRLADAVRGKKVHWLYRRFDDAVEATELARDPPNGLGAVRTCDAVRLPRLSPRRDARTSRQHHLAPSIAARIGDARFHVSIVAGDEVTVAIDSALAAALRF